MMGIGQAIRVVMNMVREYAKHFEPEEVDQIIETCVRALALWVQKRDEQEEEDFQSLVRSIGYVADKIRLAAINEGKSYLTISKALKVLLG